VSYIGSTFPNFIAYLARLPIPVVTNQPVGIIGYDVAHISCGEYFPANILNPKLDCDTAPLSWSARHRLEWASENKVLGFHTRTVIAGCIIVLLLL
jgi:hypothetical protein